MPVSRRTEVRRADLPAGPGLEVLMDLGRGRPLSAAGPRASHALHVQPSRIRHLHADDEFCRDVHAPPIVLPPNYYPDDDPGRQPENRWRSHAHLLFGNWINEMYQTTPFDLADIGR